MKAKTPNIKHVSPTISVFPVFPSTLPEPPPPTTGESVGLPARNPFFDTSTSVGNVITCQQEQEEDSRTFGPKIDSDRVCQETEPSDCC